MCRSIDVAFQMYLTFTRYNSHYHQVGSTRRPEQAAATASLAADLAAGFLFRILLRADPTLQTDLARWRSAVAALEDAEPRACRAVRCLPIHSFREDSRL